MLKAAPVIGSGINTVTQPVMYHPVIGMEVIVLMPPGLVQSAPERGTLIVDLVTIVAQVQWGERGGGRGGRVPVGGGSCVVVRAFLLPVSLIACLTASLTTFISLLTDLSNYTI